MRLSEKPIRDIRPGDPVTSAVGNPGVVAMVYPEGLPDLFRRIGDNSARILVLWSNQKWSIVDHLQADAISVGRIDRSNFAPEGSEEGPVVIIDGSGSLTQSGQWPAIIEDVKQHWSGDTPVHIVSSTDGLRTSLAWIGTARDLDQDVLNEAHLATEVLGVSITELVPLKRTAVVYTDGMVMDREALLLALRGRPHELIVMRPEGCPDPLPEESFRDLRRRDVHYAA